MCGLQWLCGDSFRKYCNTFQIWDIFDLIDSEGSGSGLTWQKVRVTGPYWHHVLSPLKSLHSLCRKKFSTWNSQDVWENKNCIQKKLETMKFNSTWCYQCGTRHRSMNIHFLNDHETFDDMKNFIGGLHTHIELINLRWNGRYH